MSAPKPHEPLQVSADDLFSPRVDAFLDEQAMLNRALPEVEPQPWILRVLYSSYFYLSLASGLGAFVGWMIFEPFISDVDHGGNLIALLLFPTVAGFVGLFLGAAEGIMCRNAPRAMLSAAVGLGVGFAGGLIVIIPAGIIFVIMMKISAEFWANPQRGQMPTGIALLIFMLGAVLGGLLGGLVFDPISIAFPPTDGEAWLSRAIGLTIIGLMVGLFVGIVEQWTKSAWLLMRAGPLAGKQFVIFRNPTVLGSSPKAEVYLFKDEAIEPRHALIHDRGGRFEIEDMKTADGTYVNGIPIQRQILKAGDQIVLGKTVLEFALRESSH
jgi:MFS family permease